MQKAAEHNESSFPAKFRAALNSSTDGSFGRFRAHGDQRLISLKDDAEAIEAFLENAVKTETTRRMYRKEAERLHMWAVLHLKKALSDMDISDFHAYVAFLKRPILAWTAEKKHLKTSTEWRPFVREIHVQNGQRKPALLSESGVLAAVSALNTMMSWFVSSGYLVGNPLGLIHKKIKHHRKDHHEDKISRFLNELIVADVKEVIQRMPTGELGQTMKYERTRFIFSMFILLGPRVSELSKSIMKDFHTENDGWFWKVFGKGSKDAKVAVPPDMLEALVRWRKVLQLPALPIGNDIFPVVPVFNKNNNALLDRPGLSSRRINEILKELFKETIEYIKSNEQSLDADKKVAYLEQASAHWLRHTAITQKVNAGIPRELVQMEARHSDARTTDKYIHEQEKRRTENAKKHKMKW